jgi:hypothetical protein
LSSDNSALIMAKLHNEERQLSPKHRIIVVLEWNAERPPPSADAPRFTLLPKFTHNRSWRW